MENSKENMHVYIRALRVKSGKSIGPVSRMFFGSITRKRFQLPF